MNNELNAHRPSPRAAIHTKYLGATNFRGSRIKATCQLGSVTISYCNEGSGDNAHWRAVLALMEKFPSLKTWASSWACGSVELGDGYIFTPIRGDFNIFHSEK